jgi:hypothetical protein
MHLCIHTSSGSGSVSECATPFRSAGWNVWGYNRPFKMKRTLTPRPAISQIFWVVLLLSAHLSAQQTNETAPQSESPKIVIEANSVLIPVVVRDSQGHSVGSLKKEDFQIFDKNKPQVISGFSIQKRADLENYRPSAEPTQTIQAKRSSCAGGPNERAPGCDGDTRVGQSCCRGNGS